MDNQITSLVQDFSQQLTGLIPEFQEVLQAKQAMDTDSVSKQLWEEKEELRETIDFMKKQGLPVSAEQNEKLALKLKDMRENPITMRYLKSLNYAGKISGKIGTLLKEAIGVDFASRKKCK